MERELWSVQKPKVGVKIRLIRRFRELCRHNTQPSERLRSADPYNKTNQYQAADKVKVSCTRTQHSDSAGGVSQTSNPFNPILTPSHLSHCSVKFDPDKTVSDETVLVFPIKRNSRGEHPAALKFPPPALNLPPPVHIFILI